MEFQRGPATVIGDEVCTRHWPEAGKAQHFGSSREPGDRPWALHPSPSGEGGVVVLSLHDSCRGICFLSCWTWCLLAPGAGLGHARAEEAATADSTILEIHRGLDGGLVAELPPIRAPHPDAQRKADEHPGTVTILEVGELTGGMQTVGDLLRRAAGLSVRESGGIGGYAGLSLRGSSSIQVPIFLDGVPLNDPSTGGTNLNDLPLQAIASIEVYRGAAPLVLGEGSLGGAVYLRSHSGRHPRTFTVSSGSFGHRELQGNSSLRWKDWVVDLRGRVLRNDGDWSFLDDRGTRYNSEDDLRRRRINNRVEGGGILLHAMRPLGSWTLRTQLLGDYRQQGTPGYSVRQSRLATSSSSAFEGRIALLGPRRSRWQEVSAYLRSDRQGFEDPQGDFGGGATNRRDRIRRVGGRASGAVRRGGGQEWSLSAESATLESEDSVRPAESGSHLRQWTVAAALEPNLEWNRLRLRPGLRVERSEDRFDAATLAPTPTRAATAEIRRWSTTLQLGARWELSPTLALKGSLARSERLPTLLERFGDRGTVQGNPQLRPERGVQRDLGLVWRPQPGRRFQWSLFDNDAFDLIVYEANSPVSTRPVNVGRADLWGMEVEADFGRYGPFDTRIALTRLSTRDRSNRSHARNAPLPGRPGLELSVQQGLHFGPARLQWELRAVGGNYLQTGRRERVPSRAVMGIDLRVPTASLLWIARVENLTDVETFDLWNFPLPGRNFSLALRWKDLP